MHAATMLLFLLLRRGEREMGGQARGEGSKCGGGQVWGGEGGAGRTRSRTLKATAERKTIPIKDQSQHSANHETNQSSSKVQYAEDGLQVVQIFVRHVHPYPDSCRW